MHLPDHYLDPLTCAATAVFSGGAITYALFRVRHEPATKVFAAAATSAAIFAAQMINFPVASGTSGHLIGGVLAGVLLGPWAGLLAMATVLLVQAVVFGDGGVLALGANILNMGVIGVAIGVMAEHVFCKSLVTPRQKAPGSAGGWLWSDASKRMIVVAFAAWLSVVAAAFACALEMAFSGTAAASEVMPAMLGVHALIGVAEGAITAATVAAVAGVVQWAQPYPSYSPPTRFTLANAKGYLRANIDVLLPAVLLAGLTPLASSLPDGLSQATDSLPSIRFSESFEVPSLLAGYAFPGIAWSPLATLLAALLGVVITYWVTTLGAFFCRPWHRS